MDNYIIKTLAYNKQVRILFMDNTHIIRGVCDNKNINKLLKIALGRTLSVTCLMSALLKGNQRISVKVIGSNRKHKIFADADSNGDVRGYLCDELLNSQPENISNMTLDELIGSKGYIQVMKDLGMNNVFTGITEMPYGNIQDDFSYYFKQSEQIPSFFHLKVELDSENRILSSKGIFVQILPGASDKLIDSARDIIFKNEGIISGIENSLTFLEDAQALFENLEVMETRELRFSCGCSKEVFYPMLCSLGRKELLEICESGRDTELVCNVCGKKYSYGQEDISNIIKWL